jgi:CheY-like chemotaxis protein
MILEREGYEVLKAADGLEGLHSLSKSLPDLIISDLNMPRMTGFEFLAVVRLRFPHIATIAMSGGNRSGEMPAGWTLTCVWSILLVLHNSAEDVMRTAYKTITPLVGTDRRTLTSKLEWETSQRCSFRQWNENSGPTTKSTG